MVTLVIVGPTTSIIITVSGPAYPFTIDMFTQVWPCIFSLVYELITWYDIKKTVSMVQCGTSKKKQFTTFSFATRDVSTDYTVIKKPFQNGYAHPSNG